MDPNDETKEIILLGKFTQFNTYSPPKSKDNFGTHCHECRKHIITILFAISRLFFYPKFF